MSDSANERVPLRAGEGGFPESRELPRPATPGPWEAGDIWLRAGVITDDGKCAYCGARGIGPPVWVGQADINGEMRLAHTHRDPDPYGTNHIVSGPDGLVCGNFDYEMGGVIAPGDAAAIAALPEWIEDRDRWKERAEQAEAAIGDVLNAAGHDADTETSPEAQRVAADVLDVLAERGYAEDAA